MLCNQFSYVAKNACYIPNMSMPKKKGSCSLRDNEVGKEAVLQQWGWSAKPMI